MPMFMALVFLFIHSRTLWLGLFADDFVFGEVLRDHGVRGLSLAFSRLMDGAFFRPAAVIPWALGQAGGGDVFLERLISLCLHYANALLLFLLAKKLKAPTIAALLCSLLFLVHPVQVEAVLWVSGRFDLLCLTFVLACLLLLPERGERRKSLKAAAGAFMALLAMLTKETGAAVLPLALAYQAIRPGQGAHDESIVKGARGRLPEVIIAFASMAPAALAYLVLRVLANGSFFPAAGRTPSVIEALSGLGVMVSRLMGPGILPGLSATHAALLCLAMAAAMVVFSILSQRTTRLVLGSVFALLFMIPALGFEWSAGEWIGSRLLYLPAGGFCLALGSLVPRDGARRWRKMPSLVFLAAALIFYSFGLLGLTRDYEDADKMTREVIEAVQESRTGALEEVYLFDFPLASEKAMLFHRDVALTAALNLEVAKRGDDGKIKAFHCGRVGPGLGICCRPDLYSVVAGKSLVLSWDKEKKMASSEKDVYARAVSRREKALAAGLVLPPLVLADQKGLRAMRALNQIVERGGGSLEAVGGDPALQSGRMDLDPLLVDDLVIEMAVAADGGPPFFAQIFWMGTGLSSYNEDNSLLFEIQTDGQYHIYAVPLGATPRFMKSEKVRAMAFHPMNKPGDIKIKYLAITAGGGIGEKN